LSLDRTIALSAGSIASLALADTAVQPSRSVSAGTGLTGGGDLSANRTIALSAGSIASLALADTAVQPARLVSAGTGLTGGGSLAADRTIALSGPSIASLAKADTAVQPSRLISVTTGLTGGGDLSANRTIGLETAVFDSLNRADTAVQPSRLVSTGTGLTGGGDLGANRTIALDSASIASLNKADTAVQPSRLISTGAGLSGGGDLSSNRTLSIPDAGITANMLAALARGRVLQVVSSTTDTQMFNTSSTYIDSGLSATITPQSTSSQILILISQQYQIYRESSVTGGGFRIQRNGVTIRSPFAAAGGPAELLLEVTGGTRVTQNGRWSTIMLDAPASISALTYKTQGRALHTDLNARLLAQADGSTDGSSTIVLAEIAG
jgi:hypothetical protein